MLITLQPELLQWARQRAQLSEEDLAEKFSKSESERWLDKIEKWQADGNLTYRQAEKLAQITQTAFGYLFLDKPHVEKLPIPDFSTVNSATTGQISADLREVIYQSQRRQDWYRDYIKEQGGEALAFVGSAPTESSV